MSRIYHSLIARGLMAAAAFALILASVAGCGASDSDCKGDPGKVTEKDYDPSYTTGKGASKTHHSADYDVTILRANGTTYEKDVSSTAYDWVKVGSKWPSAKHCKDGKVK